MTSMTTKTITVRQGPWIAKWGGGRLADIFHASKPDALDCVQVGEYDFALSSDELEASRAKLGRDDVRAALREWVAESGADFTRELPYL